MKAQTLGTIALVALTNVVASGAAMAKKDTAKKTDKAAGWCKANSCANSVEGGKNDCSGKEAKGVKDKAACEKDKKGAWTTEAKPK